MSDDAHILESGKVPTPFSAAEIRQGCPAGRTVVVRVEDGDGVRHRLSRFAQVDNDGALFERADCDAEGTAVGEVTGSRVSWRDLQGHASFSSASTTCDESSLAFPLGVEDCLRYVVNEGADETTFWFSGQRPGMPVKVTFGRGGQVLSTTVMVSDRVDGTPRD
ncbi:hypothetical protein V6K52_13910 [Knoellia sp. S7-12]|uniref:hypothetical protein n=1 Tax=Knoellia sp. S7-12 TaxID=3126698 RepID=UPI00336793A3